MKVTTNVCVPDGPTIKYVTYLTRQPKHEPPVFIKVEPSVGWMDKRFRENNTFQRMSIGILQFLSLNDATAKQKALSQEVFAKKFQINPYFNFFFISLVVANKNEISHLIRKHSGSHSSAGSVVIYIIQVIKVEVD